MGGSRGLCWLVLGLLVLSVAMPVASAGLWDSIKEKWSETKEKVKQKWHDVKQKWSEKRESYEQKVRETYEKAKQTYREHKEKVSEWVKEEWNDVKSTVKFRGKQGVEKAKQLWYSLPEEDRQKIKRRVVAGSVLLAVAYTVHDPSIAVKAAQLTTYLLFDEKEGTLEVYDRKAGDFVELTTFSEVEKATHGVIKPANFNVSRVERMPDGRYRLSMEGDAKFLWIIPMRLRTDVVVDPSTGDVDVEWPWWTLGGMLVSAA